MILSPYKAQVKLLEGLFRRKGLPDRVTISTIDGAQGKEADLVVVALVRANPTGRVVFTDDGRRLNVAITRARAGVVIVGHVPTAAMSTGSGMSRLVEELKDMECVLETYEGGARQMDRNATRS